MKIRLLNVMIAALILTGCQSSVPESIGSPDLFAESGVTEQSAESAENSETEALTDISGGIKNSLASYTYSGEPITVTYQYAAAGTPAVGFMVFCDGQPVPYHTPDEPEDGLIHTAPIHVPNQYEEIDLILTPAGKKGDNVLLQVCDINDPLFDLNRLASDPEYLALIRGLKGYFSYSWPAHVQMEADGIAPVTDYSTAFTRTPIPEDTLRTLEYEDASGKLHSRTELLNAGCTVTDNESRINYTLHSGDRLTLHLTLYGGIYPKVSVSLLVNWEPVAAFDGKTMLKAPVSADQYTECDAVLDTTDIPPGKYLCTLAVTPTENLAMKPMQTFAAEILP